MSTELTDISVEQPVRTAGYRIFLIHHTHWDREWWATFQDFRARLVEMMDDLLDTLDIDPTFRTFLLDSQMIVLHDYLEIRPENRERLSHHIRNGKVQCGPWYVLPDEFLVSGEAHIRNLWLGRRVAEELDVPTLAIGYIPDTFGHISQMPQILRGFGIDNAFMWRGRGGDTEHVKQEFLWQAPDGSEVLTHWFPDGYYQMPFLHFGNPARPFEDKLGRIYRSIEHLARRATTDVLLVPYGGDHRPFDPCLAAKITETNTEIAGLAEIHWATPDEYIEAIRERAPRLEQERGELRAFGPNTPHVLPGVLSARLYLKRLNASGQTWLERFAEPFSATAWLHGRRYDSGLLWKAWELLIQNHPHDSICGCSIDQVHREMLSRFDQSRQIAQILAERSIQHINQRVNTSGFAPGDRALVIHNPLPRSRSGWATVWIDREADGDIPINPRTYRLLDSGDTEIPFQVTDAEGLRPMSDRWHHTEIGFVANGVPGLGYRTYRLALRDTPIKEGQVFYSALQAVAMGKGSEHVTDLALGANAIENSRIRVEVDMRNGTLTITDRSSGEMYSGLNAFEDGGDAGDTYNASAPLSDVVLRSTEGTRVHVSVAEAGYARATLRVDLDWPLPEEISEDRLSRSSSYKETRISTLVSLVSESPRVEITTKWENHSRDHRLRALFPLGDDVDTYVTQGHFAVTPRPTAVPDPGNGWPEPHVAQAPQGDWAAAENRGRGLMVANRGLPEVEMIRDGRGTLALTLLRAVGWLSREDTLARSGGAGPLIPTPDAQSLGPNRACYAIIPYSGSWLESGAHLAAEEYATALYGSLTGAHAGDLPLEAGCVDISGGHTLVTSACKKAESSDALILRLWNVAGEQTEARIRVARDVSHACLVDLKEEPIEDGELPIADDGSFSVIAGPEKIVTVAVWLEQGESVL